MSDYTLDSAGLDSLIKDEGYRGHVYDDYNGKEIYSYEEAVRYPTIGIGHLIYKAGTKDEREKWRPYLKGGKKLTDAQAKDLLREDVVKYEDPLNENINQPMTQSMWNALVSLAFNAGANHRSVSNAMDAINRQDYDSAANAILNGPKTSGGEYEEGLANRRQKEYDLFLQDGYPSFFNEAQKRGILYPVMRNPVAKYSLYISVALLIGFSAWKIKENYLE
jgi:GH24 family phage-related lysozyme (muramidase)